MFLESWCSFDKMLLYQIPPRSNLTPMQPVSFCKPEEVKDDTEYAGRFLNKVVFSPPKKTPGNKSPLPRFHRYHPKRPSKRSISAPWNFWETKSGRPMTSTDEACCHVRLKAHWKKPIKPHVRACLSFSLKKIHWKTAGEQQKHAPCWKKRPMARRRWGVLGSQRPIENLKAMLWTHEFFLFFAGQEENPPGVELIQWGVYMFSNTNPPMRFLLAAFKAIFFVFSLAACFRRSTGVKVRGARSSPVPLGLSIRKPKGTFSGRS